MKTTYMHPYLGWGRATLAIMHDVETGGTVVGVAYSSPKDQFSRKRGRLIAEGRAHVGSFFGFDFVADPSRRVKEQVYEHFIDFTFAVGPKWAVRALQRNDYDDPWLSKDETLKMMTKTWNEVKWGVDRTKDPGGGRVNLSSLRGVKERPDG